MMPLITIAIPTFNRRDELLERVHEINNLKRELNVLILDNHSAYSVNEILEATEFSKNKIKYIRNNFNIGAPANILRCLEFCETKYIWVISDDDPLDLVNVNKAIEIVYQNQHISYFNFGEHNLNRGLINHIGNGVDEYISLVKTYSNCILPANSIFDNNQLLKNLDLIYHYNSSMCPQFISSLVLINDPNNYFYLSNINVVHTNQLLNDRVQWSYLMGYAGFDFILSSPLLSPLASKKIRQLIYSSLPKAHVLIASIAILSFKNNKRHNYFSLLRYISRKSPLNIKVACYISICIIFSPNLFISLLNYIIMKVEGRTIKVGIPL